MIVADASEELIQDVTHRLMRKYQGLPERNPVDKLRALGKSFFAPDAREARIQKIMMMVERAQRTGTAIPDSKSCSVVADPDVEIARKVMDRVRPKSPQPPGCLPR